MTGSPQGRRRLRLVPRLEHLLIAALAAWAVGLGVAAVRLHQWQQEVSHVLVQLRADDLLRASVVPGRDAIDPEWYRRRALALLSAVERMRDDTAWTLVMPGSWQRFDDLEERATAHIARAFGVVVVETVRRELDARASQLTGTPHRPGSFELAAGTHCAGPAADRSTPRQTPLALQDLPEHAALARFLADARVLGQAVTALASLQQAGAAHPDDLRMLVRYALGAELSGSASRGLALFHASAPASDAEVQALPARVGWALRCTLFKGMEALHHRWLGANDLLRTEEALVRAAPARLFERREDEALSVQRARMQEVAALIEHQRLYLAPGGQPWMRSATAQLGPGYEQLLRQVEAQSLMGPAAAAQLRERAAASHAQFRRRFDALFGRGGAGVVWDAALGGYTLSPDRSALADGLQALMREPFMADALDSSLQPAGHAPQLELPQQELLSLVEQRRGFMRGSLLRFPARSRAAVTRFVDGRLADLAYERASAYLMATTDPSGALAGAEALRERVGQLQAALAEAGAPSLAARVRERLERELLTPLLAVEDSLRSLPLFDAKVADFSGWQGDNAPLPALPGLADVAALQRFVADQAQRLESAAAPTAALDTPAALDPALQRWSSLRAEVARYRLAQPDSSLLALERYLAGVVPALRRENCSELLASQPVPAQSDGIGQRHLLIHQALTARCSELRASAVPG